MHIIDAPDAMAHALASILNPWLSRRLVLWRDRLAEADCPVGDLGPLIIVEPGDTLVAIEQAASVTIAPDAWEYCDRDHGWCEIVVVTGDDGSGAVFLIPDHDDLDADLLRIIRDQP